MQRPTKLLLSDDDIRYQLKVMLRWCTLYGKTDFDWVNLAAARFREKHPVIALRTASAKAA